MTNLLYYVYGIIDLEYRSRFKKYVIGRKSCALYFLVEEQDFGEAQLSQNLKINQWVMEKAIWHQELLQDATDRAAVLPLKFGSVFRSKKSIEEMLLAQESTSFIPALKKIEGKEEWGFKLNCDMDLLKTNLNSNHPVLAQINAKTKGASPGVAFLEKKKKEKIEPEIMKKEINGVRNRLYEELDNICTDLCQLKEPETSTDTKTTVLNLALLIMKNHVGDFQSFVSKREKELTDGMEIAISGPWPPYNFTS